MLEELIKERMMTAGLTRAKLSQLIGCTPTQLGQFLKSEQSLNTKTIDKCLEILGVPLKTYNKRLAVAKKAAEKLSSYSSEDVVKMTREQMVEATDIKAIKSLPDITLEEYQDMLEYEIADYESTFPFLKSLVLFFLNAEENLTPKKTETAFNKLLPLMLIPGGMVFGSAFIGIGAALIMNKKFKKFTQNAWAPFISLTKDILKK